MMEIVKKRLGVRIALIVSGILALMITAGSTLLYYRQSKAIENRLLGKGRILSIVGAKSIGTVLEEAIDNGALAIGDAFDRQYEEIESFNPPKYRTKFDAYLDRAIAKIQDEFLEDPSILFAITLDTNGYLPTHNTRFQQPITGDEKKDLSGNRTKRILLDPYSVKATQNREKGFFQSYQNEARQTVWDISSPIFVKGRHWGCFKIGMLAMSAEKSIDDLRNMLIFGSFALLMLSTWVLFFIVNRALKPLAEFAAVASELADGDVDQKIEINRKDEIGMVADVLERLRISLKAAIERLTRYTA